MRRGCDMAGNEPTVRRIGRSLGTTKRGPQRVEGRGAIYPEKCAAALSTREQALAKRLQARAQRLGAFGEAALVSFVLAAAGGGFDADRFEA